MRMQFTDAFCSERNGYSCHSSCGGCKGLPVEAVQVTIVKAPASDQEPSTEIGEILGKTDKNGDIKWDTGKKGDYSVALTKGETSVTHHISLTEDKKDKIIPLVFKE